MAHLSFDSRLNGECLFDESFIVKIKNTDPDLANKGNSVVKLCLSAPTQVSRVAYYSGNFEELESS